MGQLFHLGGSVGGFTANSASARFSLGGRLLSSVVSNPYADHVGRLRAIAPTGSYYTAQDYTASTSQAGLFVDAFGGGLTYTSPNVMASPTRLVDATSGLVYASADGADDTAVSSTTETVDTYTALIRSPVSAWSNFGGILECSEGQDPTKRLGTLERGVTYFEAQPRGVRRNGATLGGPFDLAPITPWMVVTVATNNPSLSRFTQLFGVLGASAGYQYCVRLCFACLLKWPTAPTSDAVTAAEQEMTSYYGPLIATNPA